MVADPGDRSDERSQALDPNALTASPSDDDVPDRFGEYQVDRVIARGTHGTVFKATDIHGIRVAVKWLKRQEDESELSNFVQLSKTVKGIPPILNSGTQDGRTYYVTPYYERRSLRFRLRKLRFPQTLDETLRAAGAFTEVLGELHRHGFTHSDFKPDNILIEALPAPPGAAGYSLLRDDERFLLADFGTIRSVDGLDQFGEGTLGYAAPELLTTVVDHDPRVDVYAASATLVECMTGVAPAQIRTPAGFAFDSNVLARTGPLEPVLRKGLSYDPDRRQSTMSEWFDGLLSRADDVAPLMAGRSRSDVEKGVGVAKPPADTSGIESTRRRQQHPESTTDQRTGLSGRLTKNLLPTIGLLVVVLAAYGLLTQIRQTRPFLAGSGADVTVNDSTTPAPAEDPAAPSQRDEPSASSQLEDPAVLPQPEDSAVPSLLEAVPDQRWGTPRRRLTAADPGTGGASQADGARYHRIDSSTRSVLSGDEQWILSERDGQWTAVDRATGQFHRLNIWPDGQPVWHPTEPATILYLAEYELALKSVTLDGETRTAADLTQRLSAELPDAVALRAPLHGGPSANGRYFAWAVVAAAGNPIGFVTYDLSADAILGLQVDIPSGDLGKFDSIAMSKNGDDVVVAFEEAYVIYDTDFADEWRIEQRPFSYELALSGLSQDVLVVANFESGTFGTGSIVAHNLDSRQSARLGDLYDGSNSDVLVSGLATEKPGWVLVSTFDCADRDTWSCDRVMALNVDDATVINLAQTDSCAESSFAVPNAAVNSDFTKAWFNSDFGSCGEDATIVELTIDQLNGLP